MRSKKFKTPLYGTDFEVVLYKGESEIEKYFEEQDYTVDFKNYDGGLFVNPFVWLYCCNTVNLVRIKKNTKIV